MGCGVALIDLHLEGVELGSELEIGVQPVGPRTHRSHQARILEGLHHPRLYQSRQLIAPSGSLVIGNLLGIRLHQDPVGAERADCCRLIDHKLEARRLGRRDRHDSGRAQVECRRRNGRARASLLAMHMPALPLHVL